MCDLMPSPLPGDLTVGFGDVSYQTSSHLFAARSGRFSSMQPRPDRIDLPSDICEEAVTQFLQYIKGENIKVSPETFWGMRRMAAD
jgi:hypothetical protein